MADKTCDKCKQCSVGVVSSQRSGEYQIRYLRCAACGSTAKSVLPAAEVRRRKYFTI